MLCRVQAINLLYGGWGWGGVHAHYPPRGLDKVIIWYYWEHMPLNVEPKRPLIGGLYQPIYLDSGGTLSPLCGVLLGAFLCRVDLLQAINFLSQKG